MSAAHLGRWQARVLRRATTADGRALVLLVLLALGTLAIGRQARLSPDPQSVRETTETLDNLDQPTRLPDVPLQDEFGESKGLLARIHDRHAVVAFYAPWCEPCQRELPALAAAIANHAQLLVVISQSEDVDDTRRHLTNLGLGGQPFYVDVTGKLYAGAHVTGLPATFLVTNRGDVLSHATGYARLDLNRLRARASTP
jgi:thiol-disulfide isomerase/thioredoxin